MEEISPRSCQFRNSQTSWRDLPSLTEILAIWVRSQQSRQDEGNLCSLTKISTNLTRSLQSRQDVSKNLAGVPRFTEITEHQHIMSISILNYSNQCTFKQSKDSLKIFCTPKHSDFKPAFKNFPVVFQHLQHSATCHRLKSSLSFWILHLIEDEEA